MPAQTHPLASSKLFLCKYTVDSFILINGTERIELDHSNILSIEYLNDYEFNVRAVLKVSLRVDVRRRIWILRNKRDINVKFELSKFGMDIESESGSTGSETVWNQEFKLYLSDDEEATDTSAMEARVDMNEGGAFAFNDTSAENYFETQNMIDVYLFDQRFLDASNAIFNNVFTEGLLQQCVGRILTETKHDRVLMSKFENDEVYKELLIPANPTYKTLIYLDQYYGFYKTGAIIYYDLDTVYILNSNGKVTAKKTGEWPFTTIYVTSLDDSSPGNGMFRMDGEQMFYCSVNEMNVNPQKFAEENNETHGTETTFVVTDDIVIDKSTANQSKVGNQNNNISYTKKDDNKFIANIARARKEENECSMYISGENLDITAFTPNKEYQMVFDETSKQNNYGNYKYRLAYAYHILKPSSEQYMDSSHRIVLKKRAEDEGASIE